MIKRFWMGGLLILTSSWLDAATINVSSLSQADMQAAASTAQDGDVFIFPPGTATYSAGVTWTKAVTLRFSAGATIINGQANGNSYLLTFSSSAGSKPIRITGLAINGNKSAPGIFVTGGQKNVRIDHCSFTDCIHHGILYRGFQSYGVIDHCSFTNNEIGFEGLGADSQSWNTPETPSYGLGTTNGVYLEDCYFWYDNNADYIGSLTQIIYVSNGGRVAFRHNTVKSVETGNSVPFWDSHGNNNLLPADSRGTIYTVLENNNINIASTYRDLYIRGGCLVVISNQLNTTSGSTVLGLTDEECWYTSAGGANYGQDWSTWPRQDQITNSWIVNNTRNGSPFSTVTLIDQYNNYVQNVIQQGRDYFVTNAMPPPFGLNNPAIPGGAYGYTPLIYPHPRVTSDDGPRTNAVILVGPGSADFGSIPVGAASNVTFTVQNVGASILSGSASVSPPFSIIGTATYSLASNASQVITVRYAPAQSGTYNQLVNFTGGGGAAIPVRGRTPLAGLSFDSTAGDISSPFVIDPDNTISQAVETLDPTQGGRAVYGFTITNTGNYIVSAQVYVPLDNANSFFVNIDAEPTSPTMIWDIPVNTALAAQSVTWRGTGLPGSGATPQVWTLSAGVHQLIVRGREAGAELGRISIIPSSSVAKPSPPGNFRIAASGS